MRLIRLLKHDLAREAHGWVEAGVISESQAESICSRYGIDYHRQLEHSFGYQVLVILGYLFIGLSLITLVGANWEEIPRAVRMLGLIAVTLGFNLLGVYKVQMGEERAAIGWFFLGGLCYGASIMLIAQIYHLGEHFPDGIYWWALGILPLALLMRSSLLMLLTMVLAFTWFFVESGMDYFPLSFAGFLAALGWHVFRVKRSSLLFMAWIFGLLTLAEYLMAWSLDDPYRFGFGPEVVALGCALFILLQGFAKWLVASDDHGLVDYGTLLGLWTLRFALVILFVFSFAEPWRGMVAVRWEYPLISVALSCALVVSSLLLGFRSDRRIEVVAAFSVYFLMAQLALNMAERSDIELFQVIDNLVLVGLGTGLIVLGIRRGISHYFYLGVIAILGTALLRYIDLVGDYLGAALLFAVFAGILLAVARYWKRSLVKTGEPS